MPGYRLSLFPLEVVLLPEEMLPLHIFEERYKLMIGECLERDEPFGVVLAERTGFRRVGCTARIVRLMEKFPDGRMNILTMGEQRFQVLRTHEDRPYLVGEVEDLPDEDSESPPLDLARRILGAMQPEVVESLALPDEVRDEPARLSFVIAANLRLALPAKQEFLEIRSVNERLSRLLEWLGQQQKVDVQLLRKQEKASRNGHP